MQSIEAREVGSRVGCPGEAQKLLIRFHGTVKLDPIRAGAEVGRIVQETITISSTSRGCGTPGSCDSSKP